MQDRILIAGTHSGCGKTTVTCALLAALKARGLELTAFKCGPDYIDPMFHRVAIGIPSHNLDPFFCTEKQLRKLFAARAKGLSIIEGAMGYYDGIGPKGQSSSYHVAKATDASAILVIDVKGMYASAGAVLKGFLKFRSDSRIQGVIFNGASPILYEGLRQVARDANIIPMGFLPKVPELSIPSRHLGLLTAGEIQNIQQRLCCLGELAQQYIDLDEVLAIAAKAQPITVVPKRAKPLLGVRVAIAQDEAFCFLYQENLELLQELGCDLCFFSPLRHVALPQHIGGLYLPGGYPELYLDGLCGNTSMRQTIKDAIGNGLPTIAECGGFLYLHDMLDGFPMTGVICGAAYRTEKLQRFGYATLTAKRDNLLCNTGKSIRVHEFHYYESENCGEDFAAHKASGTSTYACCHASDTLFAGFPHLYFPANPEFTKNFVQKAIEYAKKHA